MPGADGAGTIAVGNGGDAMIPTGGWWGVAALLLATLALDILEGLLQRRWKRQRRDREEGR